MTLRRALFGFIAASCLFLLIEMIDSHGDAENSVTWLPVAVTSLATVVSLAAFLQWREQRWRLALQGAGVVLIIVGLVGFFLHTGGEVGLDLEVRQRVPVERDGSALYVGSPGAELGGPAFDDDDEDEDDDDEGEEDDDEGEGPPLAPLSLVGVGILSLMATSLKGEGADGAALGQG